MNTWYSVSFSEQPISRFLLVKNSVTCKVFTSINVYNLNNFIWTDLVANSQQWNKHSFKFDWTASQTITLCNSVSTSNFSFQDVSEHCVVGHVHVGTPGYYLLGFRNLSLWLELYVTKMIDSIYKIKEYLAITTTANIDDICHTNIHISLWILSSQENCISPHQYEHTSNLQIKWFI